MGTWGEGNFENDGANDYIVYLLRSLIQEIKSNLLPEKLKAASFLELYGEYKVIPAIDIFITLSNEYDSPPEIDMQIADEWRAKYLEAFDRDDALYRGEFRTSRRKVIEVTFDRLEALIRHWD